MTTSMHGVPTEHKKEKPLNELLTSKMVDIYVGSESTHWPLHERLLTYHSPFFANIFYKEQEGSRNGNNKSYGLPDEDDFPFELLVGWLYSRTIRSPKEEKDIGPLLDLYLLAEKFEMVKLADDVVDTVREFYHQTSTYPGLRRVQYIYAETNEDNIMREMMVNSIARLLTTSSKIPAHWAKALQRNGQLAVDIIRSIQLWHIDDASIPDARDTSTERGRRDIKESLGFSEVVKQDDRGDSIGTTATMETDDTNLGIESVNTASEASESKDRLEDNTKDKEPEKAADLPSLRQRRRPPNILDTSLWKRASREGYAAFLLAWTVWLCYAMTALNAKGV